VKLRATSIRRSSQTKSVMLTHRGGRGNESRATAYRIGAPSDNQNTDKISCSYNVNESSLASSNKSDVTPRFLAIS
jgi:hypothetical protein